MKLRLLALAILLISLGYWFLSRDFDKVGSTLYTNAEVLTMEPDGDHNAEAVFVQDGIIKAIGSQEELEVYASQAEQVINLNGQVLMPGFIDPHTHPALVSFFRDMVDLSGFTHRTNASVWHHLSNQVQATPKGELILCKGLDPVLVEDLQTPSKKFLDSIAPDHPVFIVSQSMHSYWANSLAFEGVGIDKNTPDPSTASYYERDSLGELTGFLAEEEALKPFQKAILDMQVDGGISSAVRTLEDYARQGNTSIVAMGISTPETRAVDLFKFLSARHPSFITNALSRLGILPKRKPAVRHFMYVRYNHPHHLPSSVDNGDDHFKILGVKYWYDGAPYTGSMYLEDPYLESEFNHDKLHIGHNHRGEALLSVDDMAAAIDKYESQGWQIAVHSQGDQSTKEVMEAFDRTSDLKKDRRHRIEHCLMIQPESLEEMKRMDIQPSFHTNHLYYYGEALKKEILGDGRADQILPIKTADSLGLIYTMHSDAPMFPSEPLSLIQTAVTRQTTAADTIGQRHAISVIDGLKAMTINAAWQIKMEDKLGSIKVGKYADFVVLDRNPLATPAAELRDIKVLRTIVAGQDVYVR